MDLKELSAAANPQLYKFPLVSSKIESIVMRSPGDIIITDIDSTVASFHRFITRVDEWLHWFDKATAILVHVLTWLRKYNVDRAGRLLLDLQKAKESPTTTVAQLKSIVEEVLLLLRPINSLPRLCHLLNCLTVFDILQPGTINDQYSSNKFIQELKSQKSNTFFTARERCSTPHPIPIRDRQTVQWCLASEKLYCNVIVKFQTTETSQDDEILYSKNNVPVEKHLLQGEFQTQRSGQLIIVIDNEKMHNSRTIWFRVKQTPLSICYLFDGIFSMFYKPVYGQANVTIKEGPLSSLLDKVFEFIDSLLNGSVKLREMTDLKAIFCDKNIQVRNEVRKLFTHRPAEESAARARTTTTTVAAVNANPSEQEIEQVCEWLKIYQYYSHINIIIQCIEKFDILPKETDDEFIGNLRQLTGNENCSLKQITEAYRVLKQRFQNLESSHLQLIKTTLECSPVVEMMKRSNLYSAAGRRRFQELRDNLTTTFQLQERNNMILNSWIVVYALCEPFVLKATGLEEFLARIARLAHVDESSLEHMQVVNNNVQIVNMWLSTEETTALDHALITMEHVYRTGAVHFRLRRLIDEASHFEIEYSIKKVQTSDTTTRDPDDDNRLDGNETENIKFTLSMPDIDDHKRQLTFCNVDLADNMYFKKILLSEQLKLLSVIENIYSMLIKLEMAGHPEYQLRDDTHHIYDRPGRITPSSRRRLHYLSPHSR